MRCFIVCFVISILWPLRTDALTNAQLQIIKISESDGKAVARIDSGELQILEKGQRIKGIGVVDEIFINSLVISSHSTKEHLKIIVSLVNGKQQIVTISDNADDEMVYKKSVNMPVRLKSTAKDEQNK